MTNMPKHPYIYQEHGNTYQADTCEDLSAAVQAGNVRLEALARGSYPGQRLEHLTLPGIKSIGFWDAIGPQTWGLDWHRNEGIELTYLETGSFCFSVNAHQHRLKPDDLTITRPWQPHRVGDPYVEAGRLHWIILDVDVRRPNQDWKWPKWLILKKEDITELTNLLRHNEQQVWRSTSDIRHCFKKIGAAVEQDRNGNQISRLTVYINELFLHLLEMLREKNIDLNPSLSSTHRTVELFFGDLKSNRETLCEPWTVETMAQQCGLGVTSFVHYCKHLFNTTPAQYLNQLRIEAATRQLIDNPRLSITEIAYSSGFCSSQYFATVFRRHTGFSPKEFRELYISKRNI